MNDDAESGDFSRVDYTIEKLTELCDMSVSNLSAYLAGEKTSVPAPNYIVTGNDRIDGQDVIALNEINGEEEERPTFFIGFGHFQPMVNDMPIFPSLGYNSVQVEVGPDVILRYSGNVPNWLFEINGGARVTASLSDKEKVSGSKALDLTNTSQIQPNVFGTLTKSIFVKPNTTYKFGFKINEILLENIDNKNNM